MKARDYWMAARAYRSAPDAEEKHKARVALLNLALANDGIGRRAAALLRTEGLVIIRPSIPLPARAL